MASHSFRSGARLVLLIAVIAALLAVRVAPAHADDGGTEPTLTSAQLTLSLSRLNASGTRVPLSSADLTTYFNRTRCQCPADLQVALAMDATATAAVGDRLVEAALQVGTDCDRSTAATCKAVGETLTLGAQKTSTTETVNSSDLFAAATGATCTALPNTSTRLWAIVRVAGALSGATPSLAFNVGGREPVAPTNISAQSADQGLLVAWSPPADVSKIAGYQIVCAPGLATPAARAYETGCQDATSASTGDEGVPAAAVDAGADAPAVPSPLTVLEDAALCSDLVAANSRSIRIGGLDNGRPYRVAVIAVGSDGTPSPLSRSAVATPVATVGFEELYKTVGGTAQVGCAVASGGRQGGVVTGVLGVVLAAAFLRRRGRGQRRRWPLGMLVVVVLAAPVAVARAGVLGDGDSLSAWSRPLPSASTRRWDLEFRFGPYRPAIDSEFSERGEDAAPYAQIFGSGRHLLAALELDRHLAHWGGTWALGLTAGHYRVSGASLTVDLTRRSADRSAMRLIPLGVSLVYRADTALERTGFPLVPYLKAGLTCALWSVTDTSRSGAYAGQTWGWHVAAGAALALDFIDPESLRTMDQETGVNHVLAFVEADHAALNGLGAAKALHVGDTTWSAGMMFEF